MGRSGLESNPKIEFIQKVVKLVADPPFEFCGQKFRWNFPDVFTLKEIQEDLIFVEARFGLAKVLVWEHASSSSSAYNSRPAYIDSEYRFDQLSTKILESKEGKINASAFILRRHVEHLICHALNHCNISVALLHKEEPSKLVISSPAEISLQVVDHTLTEKLEPEKAFITASVGSSNTKCRSYNRLEIDLAACCVSIDSIMTDLYDMLVDLDARNESYLTEVVFADWQDEVLKA